MQKEERVLNFYVLCNSLKDLIRKGWEDWNIDVKRKESVADHIYGAQMLAISMQSEYNYDIDLYKVVFMLAIHELEEVFITDITPFDMSKEEKKKLGEQAVEKILECLTDKEEIHEIINEWEENKTPEAKFSHMCDKLECDLQSKIYEEKGAIHYKKDGTLCTRHTKDNYSSTTSKVQELLKKYHYWSTMWMKFWQSTGIYDENFTAVSNYAIDHKITKVQDEITKFREKIKEKKMK